MAEQLALGRTAYLLVTAVDLDGQRVTGLDAGDFTLSLKRRPSGGAWAAAPESVSVAEISSGQAPGQYEVAVTPAVAGQYLLEVTPTFANAAGGTVSYHWEATKDAVASAGALCTRDQVRLYLDAHSDETKYDALIDELIPAVTEIFEGRAGRPFGRAQRTEYPRGGGKHLVLRATPAEAAGMVVTECATFPRAHDTATPLTDSDFVLDEETGILERAAGRWADGLRAVRVVYTGGYGTIPADINRAAIRAVAHFLTGARMVGVSSASGPEGSVTRYDFDRLPWDVKDTIERYRTPVVG